MPTPKKRKAKSTLFKSVASSPPLSLRPRPDAGQQPLIAQMIEAFVAGVEHLGISLSALIAEFNRYFEAHSQPALPPPPSVRLTHRELEIVALMADHLSNQQIANVLHIEMNTLKTHLRHIYRKLGNRGQVLEWWERYGRTWG